MIAAHPIALSLLFIGIALLAHIASRQFTPFKRVVRMTGETTYFDVSDEDIEVGSVLKFLVFHALKWLAAGMALAIVIF